MIARTSRVGRDRAGGDDAAADGLADRRGHLHVDSRTLGPLAIAGPAEKEHVPTTRASISILEGVD